MKQLKTKTDAARLLELNGKPWDSLTQDEKQEHNTLVMAAVTGKRSPAKLQERADTEGWEATRDGEQNAPQTAKNRKAGPIGTVDCTPTWQGVILIHATVWGESQGVSAKGELLRCAKLADERNAMVKRINEVLAGNTSSEYGKTVQSVANFILKGF